MSCFEFSVSHIFLDVFMVCLASNPIQGRADASRDWYYVVGDYAYLFPWLFVKTGTFYRLHITKVEIF